MSPAMIDFPRNPRPANTGVSVVIGEGGQQLPLITHATIADAFLAQTEDFKAVYDIDGRPTAQWVGTRWEVSKDTAPLREAVGRYVQGLYELYPEADGKIDPRRKLLDSGFVAGVMQFVAARLPKTKFEVFDRNPYLLGLPGCNVVDLRTGEIRTMLRTDYITQRLYVSPADTPTPRFDRFLSEITCGDVDLAEYLLRLAALTLTAEASQKLFFLWGSGRNGKGVFIRLLTAILGKDNGGFAVTLNPDQITVAKMSTDTMKRVYSSLEGKRLAAVEEATKGNLNHAMLKQMSGGDALSGARMRQDARTFKPTHKLLLSTNERPQLPADDAFRGRVHFIPFKASFVGREDATLEATLHNAELGGIVRRLIQLAPDVLLNGLRPPAVVVDETEQLFDELDDVKQFIEERLVVDTSGAVRRADMQDAVRGWLTELSGATGVVVSDGGSDIRLLAKLKVRFPERRLSKARDAKRSYAYHGCRLSDMAE